MKIIKHLILAGILVTTLLSSNTFARENLEIVRYKGNSRYDTAVEVSKNTFTSSNYAIIASGDNYPDALVGGTLAVQIKAPILLVKENVIPQGVITELKRLNTKKVFLLGGEKTISKTVYEQLISNGFSVDRAKGYDRLETAKEIAKLRYKYAEYVTQGERIAMVDGYNFADSLSAAPFVAQLDSLTYLYPYVKDKTENIRYYMAFGGTNSVPKGYVEKVRIKGKSRYDTAVEIAKEYKLRLNKTINTVILVDGRNYPDALSSAPLTVLNNGAILLTEKENLNKAVSDFINNNKNIKKIIIVGGESSVSKKVESQLRQIK
ncbi:MAG: cell wall-binding repeat-containing protein [Lagierella massiliensis]|nr:cell wall-binding repeat-containing protein [Lagierella massiliensis]